ncbi:hypothetical protein UPYG_G00136680 [Umbra pygmaea]|uniref:Uncharacterized protein n=1 Tax=Umbra pygmaea TaxID=75934 RepID=A0ABD0WUD0_UMBPY
MTDTGRLALAWYLWLAVSFTAGVDETPCPRGAQVHLDSLQCYWLSSSAKSWLEAKRVCGEVKGGDLATIRSSETQAFIHISFPLTFTEWVWVRSGMAQGPGGDDGVETESHHGWEGEGQGECTQMALGSPGQRRNTACDGHYLFLCEKNLTVSLPSLDSYLIGVPLMSGVYGRAELHVLPTVPDTDQQRVEMLMFPGLWFSHAGLVVSVELVSQPREEFTQVRVQVLRPYCSPQHHLVPPGCSSLLNPFSCCSTTPLCNTTGGCSSGQYWCHLLEACVSASSPCSPYNHSPSTGGPSYLLPPRYSDSPPFYHLVADIPLVVSPSTEPTHLSITLTKRTVTVYPDDILAVQYTGLPGTFLQCRDNISSLLSPWRQSYISLPGAEWGGWREGGFSLVDGGHWVDGQLCDLRVLYVDTLHQHNFIPSTDQRDLSGSTLITTISPPIRVTHESSILAPAQRHLSGLCVIHPQLDADNQIHLLVNSTTLIVVKILSGEGATSSWLAPVLQTGVPFLPSCPRALADSWPGCERDSPDSWFSHVSVVLPSVGLHLLNVSAVNEVTEQTICVKVCVHEPVTGLSVEPHGHLRMLVDIPQVFTAKVERGSSLKYTWVIDGLDAYSYEGNTYTVVFKKPAEYKLKVKVANPVSMQSLVFALTADTLTPLTDPEFISNVEVIAVDTQQLYTFRVKSDVSLGITFSWSFGDGSAQVNHTFPALSKSQDRPIERGVRQVYVQDSVSHAYLQPDDYTLTVEVYNQYDSIQQALSVKVRLPLTHLLISTSPPVSFVYQSVLLEAFSQPFPNGVLYTWDFGDGSEQVQGFSSQVAHVVRKSGVFNITVSANNSLSSLAAWVAMEVVEKISGLQLICIGSGELKSVMEIKGKVASGSGIRWDWDFGDGSESNNTKDSSVSHVYKAPGIYTVRVNVSNKLSQGSQSIHVEIYSLAISGILPSDCSESKKAIQLQALLKGNVSLLMFQWTFGDGSPMSIQKGRSTVTHTYSNPGIYKVNVSVVSKVASVFYDANTCIEALITKLSIQPSQNAVAVGEEVCFQADTDPKTQPTGYQFLWFDRTSNSSPIRGLAHHCFLFKEEGIHVVEATASNLVSQRIGIVTVSVLKPNALEVGQYILIFTVSFQGSPLHLNRATRIHVIHSSLVPIISGGSHRLVSSHSDLILDGSESYDPDGDQEDDGELKFLWDFITEDTTEVLSQDHVEGYNSRRCMVPSRELQPDRVYLFRLTVHKEGRRPVCTTQSVTVLDVAVLPVSVKCVSCSTLSSFRVSYSRPILLSGHCDQCGGHVEYKWSAKDQNGLTLDLNEVMISSQGLSPDLVVRPGSLLEGCNYTFKLNVSHIAGGHWGSATLTLQPNSPPHRGVCTLTPGSGENIRLLETVVTYNCSGWMDEDSEASQLIYIFQVSPSCTDQGQACPVFTLYRGTQSTFGSLVPLGETGPENGMSTIIVILQIDDSLGSRVTVLNRTLTVLRPLDGGSEWLRNRSKMELWALLQQGNRQPLISFCLALSSQLNQVHPTVSEQDLRDRREIRGNVTQALASLSVFSLVEAAQISSALAQSTAVPNEVVCEGCQEILLESMGRMIRVMEEQTEPPDDTAIDMGKNILHVVGSVLAAVSEKNFTSSGSQMYFNVVETTASALDNVGALMRSLMRWRTPSKKTLALSAPQISAVGHYGNPSELLCTPDPSANSRQSNQTDELQLSDPPCQFLIPPSLRVQLQHQVGGSDMVQIVLGLEAGSEFLSEADPPISTSLAAMEFTTPQGQPIPITNLDTDRSIRVTLTNRYTVEKLGNWSLASGGSVDWSGGMGKGRAPGINFTLPANGWMNFTVKAVKHIHDNAGLYISLNFSLLPGVPQVASGHVRITVATQLGPPASHNSIVQELNLSLSTQSAFENTIFLSPLMNSTRQSLQVNLTSTLSGAPVQATVCVFSSLCQYFNLKERRWSSEGLQPLDGSTLHSANCLTQHLTMFGASLFVHPDALVLLPPAGGPVRNVVVGVVCAVLVLIHLLLGLIANKLDHLEQLRQHHIPLCGHPGRYSYRVLVKTGWGRGAGTTANVGISLHGVTKSGSRHLQREGAFQRNGLDLFHLETDWKLGEVWKIRLWHDNTGLDPSWYVKHVVVWDPQTDHLFYFLVEDWLSVDNDKTEAGGTVEKDVLASCPEELSQFRRVLVSQLVFGMQERHLWLSVWECPAHSCFTRGQRVTVCALLLHLFLAAAAMWYGAVGTDGQRGPVSARLLVTSETVVTGMVVAIMVFPLQCLVCLVFRKTRRQVAVDLSERPSPVCQSVEIEVNLGQSDLSCSSFLSMPEEPDWSGLDRDTPSSLMGNQLFDAALWNATNLAERMDGDDITPWPSCDSLTDNQGPAWEITSDPLASSLGPAHLLKRKKALMKLCLASTSCSHAPLSPSNSPRISSAPLALSKFLSDLPPESIHRLPASALTLTEEDFLKSVSADTEDINHPSTPDSGRYSPRTSSLSPIQSQGSSCSGWSELSVDKILYGTEKPPSSPTSLYGTRRTSSFSVDSITSTSIPSPSPDSVDSTTRIGVARGKPSWLLPPWMLRIIYPLVVLVLGACLAAIGLYGSYFSSSVVLMWLISALSAFLTSALLLEPLKVCLQALLYAVVFRTVDPEVNDRLGQDAVVSREGGKHGGKVRPPCGFGLLQAKEEARKLRALRSLMKHCLCQMLFLLLVTMMNYQDSVVQDIEGRLLRSAVKHALSSDLKTNTGWEGAWQWMDNILVPHLHQSPALHLVGLPRIRCIFTPGQERVLPLGNSSLATRKLLSSLLSARWTAAQLVMLSIDFTQYHRETGVFVCVSVLLQRSHTLTLLSSLSIYPLVIPPSSSGPDLQIALMVLLLLSALFFLGAELWAMVTERAQYVRRGWHWFQLILALLSLATATLRFRFLFLASSCLSQHQSRPDSFIEFHSAALLARKSTQISAVLLTLLFLKMVGTLRFVRRWVVFGRVLQQARREMAAVAILLVLLTLLFTHTGHMLFSRSVDGFVSMRQAVGSVLSMFRGRLVLQRLSRAHPVLGPLYALSLLGLGGWLLARFSGAVLLRTYRFVHDEMYLTSMEPQDYEMVEFFVKRLKLWMGLTKAKEFRHTVKFEGLVAPPSRSSRASRASILSSSISSSRSSYLSSPGPRSSTTSLQSDDSGVSDVAAFDIQPYLERLLPCVEALLSRFDRINQLTTDIYGLEKRLVEVQSSRVRRTRQGHGERGTGVVGAEGENIMRVAHSRISLPSASLTFNSVTSPAWPTSTQSSLRRISSSFSESAVHQLHPLLLRDTYLLEASKPTIMCFGLGMGKGPSGDPEARQLPRRRAWHSGSSQSTNATHRPVQAFTGGGSEVSIKARPWSREGECRPASGGLPVKRSAWISEGPEKDETEKESDRLSNEPNTVLI